MPVFLAGIHHTHPGRHLIVLPDKEEAAYLYNDLVNLLGDKTVLFFPSSFKRSVQYWQKDNENVVLRTNVLSNSHEKNDCFIVTFPEALLEKVISRIKLEKNTLQLKTGEEISIDFINDVLTEYRFQLVDFVYEPGQYAIRGSIVDIFSFSNEDPYRIDFFGDEVDSIRTFNIENQLSKEKLEQISIIPDIQNHSVEKIRETIFDYLPDDYVVWIKNYEQIIEQIDVIYNETDFTENKDQFEDDVPLKDDIIVPAFMIKEQLSRRFVVEHGQHTYYTHDQTFEFNTSPQPLFHKKFDLLASNLKENRDKGYNNYILSDNPKQIERLRAIFEDTSQYVDFEFVNSIIHEGFIDHDLQVAIYTDHQIFDRYHKYKLKSNFSKKESLTFKDLSDLHPGDYVVHIDHGIGKFGGLEKIEVSGKMQETIRLIYKDNDVLYVSIHSLHRISKYKGKDGVPPKIYKLGSAAWQRLKQKTKSRVKDIAKDLIALYAKRKEQEGFRFSEDTYLQKELESSFIFEDTPDQLKTTQSVKTDMEMPHPMDRLICGDVGFGKTEIAIRAAFKAVTESKQVAVLVPTTILALQHYNTFKERLANFPCTVNYFSRMKKPAAQKEILSDLADGKLDIIIGTHRLVGKDVKFKNLGLLIVDEEQKFGVSVKEKLKQLKINVDTLTMTATPIPRTMQFSLMGARDLSIINTAPPNRIPIETELHTFNEAIIKEAIKFEVERNGQVFFIHNRIQNIVEIEALVNKICPKVKTVIAHGQMDGARLESIMLDFIAGGYDVLIGTTIIESGLDIPNANTIIINNAHHFGLSDLHQLRGRVGRSNKKAFCYLLAPPVTLLTPDARRRLKAIEEFSDLGSGFNIAMQDLDIRGAGNLLGGEQSGFIADIGFETYHRILNEALLELKENEYKDLYSSDNKEDKEDQLWVNDCVIDTDFEMLLPERYISNISERIHLYRTLDSIDNEEALVQFEKQLVDRFGLIPDATRELLRVVRLRWLAIQMGFEKIILKNNKMLLYFVSNQNSPYYQSPTFQKILHFIQEHPKKFSMKEAKDKLSMSTDNVKSIKKATNVLREMTGLELIH